LKLLSLRIKPFVLTAIAMLVPVAHLGYLFLAGPAGLEFLSEQKLVAAYQERDGGQDALYYLDYMPVSAAYYSRGKAQVMTLGGQSQPLGHFWLAAHKTRGNHAPETCQLALRPDTGLFELYECDD